MTRQAPEFDVEKRRRWYAVWFGIAGATSVMIAFLITEGHGLTNSEEQIWILLLVLLGFWLCTFLLKYVAGYAIWMRPYASRKRAIVLSVTAMFAVYAGIFGLLILFNLYQGRQIPFKDVASLFYTFNKALFGHPYVAAAIVGWCFAKQEPDIRETF